MKLTGKIIKTSKDLENRTKICLGYYTKYKIVCEKCKNPYNKYCPFYLPFKSKTLKTNSPTKLY
jgi:hypothetical protein